MFRSASRAAASLAALPITALALAVLLVSTGLGIAQSGDPKPPESKPAEQAAPASPERSERTIRADQTREAGRTLRGPAANAECVWLGERAVGLLWRDDLDTAFRHLDLYDRFGCPGGHVQTTFRCVVRQGNIDPKSTETLNARVHACWLDPEFVAVATPAPAPSPQNAAQGAAGTNAK